MPARSPGRFEATYATNQFSPRATEFGAMVDGLMSRLPDFMEAHTSVWTTVLFHRDDMGSRKRPSRSDVTLRLDLEEDQVTVALSLSNGPMRLSRVWTGSLQDAPDLVVDWTAELLRLRERRGERVALEIDLEP